MFDLIEAVPDSAQPYISLLWFCFLRHRCTLCLLSLGRNLFYINITNRLGLWLAPFSDFRWPFSRTNFRIPISIISIFAKFRQNFISISARNSSFPAKIVMFRLNFQYSISQNWRRFLTEFSRLERFFHAFPTRRFHRCKGMLIL